MYILGISAYYHDSAACLIFNGKIIAAVQEERFTRLKNDASFPRKSIAYCLETAGIALSQVDHIVYYEKPFLKFERLLETYVAFAPKGFFSFIKAIPLWIKEKLFLKKLLIKNFEQIDKNWENNGDKLLFTDHHQSHAASAFYPSPFDEAIILTVDGTGEWVTTQVSKGKGNAVTKLSHIDFPHSIGLLYSAFTYYLGFKVNCDEYKVMGLAPYGKPVYKDLILEKLVDMKKDGSFRLDMRYFNYATGLTMTGKKFDKLFGQLRRTPGAELSEFHKDIAASIQKVTEEIMLKITSYLYKQYGIANLCLAGGVALNCVANGKILRGSGFKNIWIQPAAGDAGCALGACYAVYHEYLNNERTPKAGDMMQAALLGPAYNDKEVIAALENAGLSYQRLADHEFYDTIAKEIAGGKVIGYFKGRMEFGPRALGARSVLADPRNADMQSVLNLKIKFRESFRPFAPAILEEYAAEYFELNVPGPYMLLVSELKTDKRVRNFAQMSQSVNPYIQQNSVLPAVTHVDYTARVQTVNAVQHPDFYKLIKAFYDLTGCPAVINTSFNRMDEPIVCSPQDAIQCFLNTGIDVLAIENYLVYRL